jgi:hypothetical protein
MTKLRRPLAGLSTGLPSPLQRGYFPCSHGVQPVGWLGCLLNKLRLDTAAGMSSPNHSILPTFVRTQSGARHSTRSLDTPPKRPLP